MDSKQIIRRSNDGASPLLPTYETRESEESEESSNKLGTVLGVIVPCLLSIFGAILFLRLPWAVGQAGLLELFAMFFLATLTVVLTTLSIAAISTNGDMRGGGAYFLISRSIGPEFGGSVGVVFFAAQSIGACFYLTAFAENATDTFSSLPQGPWGVVLIGSIGLAAMAVAAGVGASFFSRLNIYILAAVLFAIFSGALSLVAEPIAQDADGFTGLSTTTFNDNLESHYDSGNTFTTVFAVIFPAVTGIMAGANMSGDLKDPGKSIGPGTLIAIAISIVVYLALAGLFAGSIQSDELRDNFSIIQDVNYSPWPIVAGIWASTLSSGLNSLIGGARIMQALARDNLISCLSPFAVGQGADDEPIRALILTWGIAQACLLIGNLNAIAAIISNFFLLTYAFTNLACMLLRVSGAPNFRPHFKWFTWHTAALGAILSLALMFMCDVTSASVSVTITIVVFAWIMYSSPAVAWGDVKQALVYHQVRKYLLTLTTRVHPKFWRPSVLLLWQQGRVAGSGTVELVQVCNSIKKGGIFLLGDVLTGDPAASAKLHGPAMDAWRELIDDLDVKAFPAVCLAESWLAGARALMSTAGIGGMRPNTVCMPLDQAMEQASTGAAPPPPDAVDPAPPSPQQGSRSRSAASNYSPRLMQLEGTRSTSVELTSVGEAQAARVAAAQTTTIVTSRLREGAQAAQIATALGLNVLFTRNFASLISAEELSRKRADRQPATVDVWLDLSEDARIERVFNRRGPDDVDIDAEVALLLQLAHVMHRSSPWEKSTTIRVLCAVPENDAPRSERAGNTVRDLLKAIRISAVVHTCPLPAGAAADPAGAKNQLMRLHSYDTALLFAPAPSLEDGNVEGFVSDALTLTDGLPPIMLCITGSATPVVTTAV